MAYDTGLIIGKFMPLHRGHMYLIDHARCRVTRLTVLVCSLVREPIPGVLRYQWVRDLYPDVNVQHCTDENPSEPHEHPDFWNIWTRSIRRFCPTGPEVVFTSELYGDQLAQRLGAQHEMVDLERKHVPVSGIAIRARPFDYWDFLPPQVQAYFANTVNGRDAGFSPRMPTNCF